MSKRTHWRFFGSNLEDMTREEKEEYRKKSFKNGLAVERMKTVKYTGKRKKPITDPPDDDMEE